MPKKQNLAPAADHGMVIEYHNATGSVSFWEKSDNHSVADKHGVSTVDYIHAMYDFLRQSQAKHVLMIGCGGGTLATMLHRAGVKVTIADIDARNYEIARTYFHMPDEVECHVADGAAFLKKETRKFDAVVLDAYADNDIPRHFKKVAFFNLMKSRMKARGAIVLANLIVSSATDKSPDRIAKLMGRTWKNVRLLDSITYETRNAIAVAGAVKDLAKPKLTMRPSRGAKSLAREIAEFDFRPLRV
ncbi:spermidine synthase [Rhizomicrobium palustre]|uniref:Spermidine synthase n=1 Tax=Rhizomicrobium palustre TaxID=189966 RepID=A0A846MVU0_9PROT|nr:fused MFS/spermidine synthase [Rhizomicrobium palustre]NIK87473.1 spermidine synthase [Rhizomicrobium palustre]